MNFHVESLATGRLRGPLGHLPSLGVFASHVDRIIPRLSRAPANRQKKITHTLTALLANRDEREFLFSFLFGPKENSLRPFSRLRFLKIDFLIEN